MPGCPKQTLKASDHDLRTSNVYTPKMSVKWSGNRNARFLRTCWEDTASFLILKLSYEQVCNREVESALSPVMEVVLRVPVEHHLGLPLQPVSEEKHHYEYQKEVLKVLSYIQTMVKQ